MVHNYDELRQHVGHSLECVILADRADIEDGVAIRCLDCNDDLVWYDKEEECPDDVMWQLTITHQVGSDNYFFHDAAEARKQLFYYVEDLWNEEFPGEPMPEDEYQAIAEFFEGNEHDSYILVEQPVMCKASRN